MASQIGLFKIEGENEMPTTPQIAEILRQHLDPKVDITIGKPGNSLTKLTTGYKSEDIITIKKNAYHGAKVSITPKSKEVGYGVINVDEIVPNALLNQVSGGYLANLLFNAIFGNDGGLYDKLEEVMTNVLKAKKVDTSQMNIAKSIFTGKSVMEE